MYCLDILIYLEYKLFFNYFLDYLTQVIPELICYKVGEQLAVDKALDVVRDDCPTSVLITRPVLLKALQNIFGGDVTIILKRTGAQQDGYDLRKRAYPY